jgi:hypothetical protein
MTTGPRQKLDGPWTEELRRPPPYRLRGVARIVIGLPAALIFVAAIILLVHFLR